MNFVTGATGIVGSHVLLKLLQLGEPVTAGKQEGSDVLKVKRLFSYYGAGGLFEKIRWKEADITNVFSLEEAFEGVETVYHCAGFVSFHTKDRKKLFNINEVGTSNVVTAATEKKVKALCHVSSLATVNSGEGRGSLNESVFWKRSGRESDYAISKYNAEREVWRGMEEGLPAVIVNPGVILSPGFWRQSSGRLFAAVLKGNSFYTDGTTGYVSARDVAGIMIRLMEKRTYGNRYIVVEGNYTFKQILESIASHLELPKPGIKAGKSLLYAGRFFDAVRSRLTGAEQVLTIATIYSAFNKQLYDNSKIRDLLAYNFIPVEEEIKEICRILKAEKALNTV